MDLLKKVIRTALFLLLMAGAVSAVNRLLVPKYMYDNMESATESYNGFYGMNRNTVDVIVVGTSQAATGFNPQDMYNARQVRAYNLSCSVQNMRDTYYWVKEAFKTQKPKAVLLDAYYLFSDVSYEASSRKGMDWMRNDEVKVQDVRDAVRDNPDWSALSYFLTNIRYHTRWTELNENDFTFGRVEKPSALKGFWNYMEVYGGTDFTPLADTIDQSTDLAATGMAEKAEAYLDQLYALCVENGCTLVLVKTPGTFWSAGNHKAVQNYADTHNLLFLDFNLNQWYQAAGFDYQTDMSESFPDNAHCNLSGARKLSRFMADILVEQGICASVPDEQWESTRDYNEETYQEFQMHNTDDIYAWLYMLDTSRYTVIFSKRFQSGDGELNLPDEMHYPFDALGLSFADLNTPGKSYTAVIEGGEKIQEESQEGSIDYRSTIRDGLVRLEVTSGDDFASIALDGQEYAQGTRGLNIVVYDNERKCVVDSVVIDMSASQTDVIR